LDVKKNSDIFSRRKNDLESEIKELENLKEQTQRNSKD